jgi:hypothetical protein
MRKQRSIWILLGLASLALVLVACGAEPTPTPTTESVSAPAQTDATPTPTPEAAPPAQADAPTDTPPPAAPSDTPPPGEPATSVPSGDLDASSLTSASSLSSYRSYMNILVTEIVDGKTFTETVDFRTEFTSEPPAQHVSVTGTGIDEAEGMDSVEWYQVEDTIYMKVGPDEWVSMPASESGDLTTGLVTPEVIYGDTCGWQSQGITTLNGIEVERWTTNYAWLNACLAPAQLTAVGGLTDAGGEMFVALDGSYVVQMDYFYVGTNLDLDIVATDDPVEEGRLDFYYELTDANQPFTIDLPPGAQAAASGPEDIPIPDNAQDIAYMGNLITFTSPDPLEEVVEYYRTQMPGYGWSEVSANEMGAMFMLEFAKEGKTASIMFQTDDSGGTAAFITTE